ncbi:MAG: hypothetical protein CES88_16450 [Halobacteriovorax sp. JY17]|nr:MAG: hypothetical protein CES88_16450 [Halobacteriovorax sp. JY17]
MSPNDKDFSEKFDIDPRVYALVFFSDYFETDNERPEPKFRLPTIKFYDDKSLEGSPVGLLSSKGLFLNEKKICSTFKISNGEYDILYEKEIDPAPLRGTGAFPDHLFSPHYLVGKGNYLKYYSKCSFIKYYQKATWDYRSVLILDDLDERRSIATIQINSKPVYFSTKNLKLQAVLRPPAKELEHRSISLIEFAKEIEKELIKFRKKSLSVMLGVDAEKIKKFNEVYIEKERGFFNVSSLDWMDKYGEQELKKRLIKNFGETRFLRHFDFENMYLSARLSHSRKGSFIKLTCYYKGIGRKSIAIGREEGSKFKYIFNFGSKHSFEEWEERTSPNNIESL